MNSMTLPRWFGRRKKKNVRKGGLGNYDQCFASDDGDVNKTATRRSPSPKRTSKSTYDIPTYVRDNPLATSEATPLKSDVGNSHSVSERNLNHIGTPNWHVPKHEDIISARQNLRKTLSETFLPTGSQIYENVSQGVGEDDSNYQNVDKFFQRFSYSSPAAQGQACRVSIAQLGILDELEENIGFERMDLLRASKKLFASQRDILQQQQQRCPPAYGGSVVSLASASPEQGTYFKY